MTETTYLTESNFAPIKGAHSLARFAETFFSGGTPWKFTNTPIVCGLLHDVADVPELNHKACVIFWSILHYMGDIRSKQRFTYVELTDEIFAPALIYSKRDYETRLLKNEIYCQLMKQLTMNPDIKSEERGWQLMWLAAGVFTPIDEELTRQLFMFLETRHHPYSLECMRRLRKHYKGDNGYIAVARERKLPPHIIEVEAILNRKAMIFHKFYFPDGSDILIEIDSLTTVHDLTQAIISRLQIKSSFGFSLFIEYNNRAQSIPANEYFFDVLRQQQAIWVQQFIQEKKNVDYGPAYFQYTIYFLKKIWARTVPGEDEAADLICHYYQENSKYLSGYHSCSLEDAHWIAALTFRAEGHDESRLDSLSSILRSIVPHHVLRLDRESNWIKKIRDRYYYQGKMTADEAKVEFLQYISKWPTFGSAFFEIKQTHEATMPEDLILAINRNGVLILNAETKKTIAVQPFHCIDSWKFNSRSFEIVCSASSTSSQVEHHQQATASKKFICETNQGYRIDDLLTSYVELMKSSGGVGSFSSSYNSSSAQTSTYSSPTTSTTSSSSSQRAAARHHNNRRQQREHSPPTRSSHSRYVDEADPHRFFEHGRAPTSNNGIHRGRIQMTRNHAYNEGDMYEISGRTNSRDGGYHRGSSRGGGIRHYDYVGDDDDTLTSSSVTNDRHQHHHRSGRARTAARSHQYR